MIKKLAAVIALVLVVCTFAGCTTTNNTNQTPSATTSLTTTTTSPSQSPTATAATHDALLESLAAADYNSTAKNQTITSWDVLWSNSTTVRIQASGSDSQKNPWSANETFMRFPSNDAATAYLKTYNRTGYTYSSPTATTDILYYKATGRLPTVFQGYVKTSSENYFVVTQTDDVIQIMELNSSA